MNYPPLMQQLPPMPMNSNYPGGHHEPTSAPSAGPPTQYSSVMHGMSQSAHAVSQSNYMLQSNAAAAAPSLPTNNNMCNDFASKSQRCSNMAMVQGGCMNTNLNSIHQGAPNYSPVGGANGANYMNGGDMYGGYQTMPQQMNSMPLRQANVSAGYGGNVPQQPAMHPNHPHNGLHQHFPSIHRKSVPPNYNPYTMQSQGMNASTGYPMTNRPPNLQQQQRHFMMQQQPQLIMQQKSGNLNTMASFKGVAGNGMDTISGMTQPPYNMNCSAPKPSNSQIMRLPSSNSPSYSVNNIPLEMQNSNKSLSGVQVNLNAMQPPVAAQPQNAATLSGYPGGANRNLQLQQESQTMTLISKGDTAFSNKVGLNSLVCSPPVSAPANNNNDIAFRNQQNSLSPGFCLSPNPKIVSPNVSMHSQLLANPCIQNNTPNTNLPRDQSVRSVPGMATSPFSPSSHRKRNNSNGAASPAHTDSLGCEAKIQKTLAVTLNADSSLNGVKTPQTTSDLSSSNDNENSELRQKFDDLVIEIVCRTPVTTTPSLSEKSEGMDVGLEEVLNAKSSTKNSLNGLVTQTGSKNASSNSSVTLSANDKSPLSKLIEDLQIDKLEKLPDLTDDHLDDLNMITSKRLPSCNVQDKTPANVNPSFVPS